MESHNVLRIHEVEGKSPESDKANMVVSSHWADKSMAVVTVAGVSYTIEVGEMAKALTNAERSHS